MCRHLAYLGPPRPLAAVLLDPPHGLREQSFKPRCQEHGRVNADGFGLGWWADGAPARYRRAVPIWSDPNLEVLAAQVGSGAIMGAVRDATTGSAPDEAAVAPLSDGGRLFSHNGVVPDWRRLPEDVSTGLAASDLLGLEAQCDSALLWAMIGARLAQGQTVEAAVAALAVQVAAARPEARLNLLVMDRRSITALRWGDSLHFRQGEDSVAVASEPWDDDGWREVPEGGLVLATATETVVRSLSDAVEREKREAS